MPIYGFGVNGAPWTLCREIKKTNLVKFIKILREARNKFKHSKNEVFCKSITYNLNLDEPYIAKYDCSKTNLPVEVYSEYMEELIAEANSLLTKNNKYKFDIIGNWEMGKIIIMVKK